MSDYEKYNIEILMFLKSQVEKLGYLPKEDALYLIQTCASLILLNEDVYKKNLTWQTDGRVTYEERMLH